MNALPRMVRLGVWHAGIEYPIDAPDAKINPLQLPPDEDTAGIYKFRWEGLDMVIAQTLEDYGALKGDKFIEQAMAERPDAWWVSDLLVTRDWLRKASPRLADPDPMDGIPRAFGESPK